MKTKIIFVGMVIGLTVGMMTYSQAVQARHHRDRGAGGAAALGFLFGVVAASSYNNNAYYYPGNYPTYYQRCYYRCVRWNVYGQCYYTQRYCYYPRYYNNRYYYRHGCDQWGRCW